MTALSEQEIMRRQSLQELRKLGIDPYPAVQYPVSAFAKDIKENYTEGSEDWVDISLAGRIMNRRIMGSASFAELQDSTGRIQLYLNRDELCPGEDKTIYNRSEEHTSELQSLMRISYAVFCLKKKNKPILKTQTSKTHN